MYTVLQAARAFCYTVGKNLDLIRQRACCPGAPDCASVILWVLRKGHLDGRRGHPDLRRQRLHQRIPAWAACGATPSCTEIGAGTSEIRRMTERPRAVRRKRCSPAKIALMTSSSLQDLFVHNREWAARMERDRPGSSAG